MNRCEVDILWNCPHLVRRGRRQCDSPVFIEENGSNTGCYTALRWEPFFEQHHPEAMPFPGLRGLPYIVSGNDSSAEGLALVRTDRL